MTIYFESVQAASDSPEDRKVAENQAIETLKTQLASAGKEWDPNVDRRLTVTVTGSNHGDVHVYVNVQLDDSEGDTP